jgi:hypothetical protein
MPKWFEDYLRSLPDYKVDELLAWTGTDGPDFYEKMEELVSLLTEINS